MTIKAPVSLCLIVKNEAPRLEKCLNSIKDYVSEIVIVDTGSDDNTVEIAKQYTDKIEVYTDCNNENGTIRSFSEARNRSFSKATQPWILWIDGDDWVQHPERLAEVVADYDRRRIGQPCFVMFPYEYSHDEHGNCTLHHYRERLICHGSNEPYFHWVNHVHEVIIPISGAPVFHPFQDDRIKVIHNRVNKFIEPGRNLRILKEVYEKDGEKDARQLYYLGLEYSNVGDFDNANKILKRYTELSGWEDEKFLACIKIADNYTTMHHQVNDPSKIQEAIDWATKALTIKENWGEAYFSLAKSHYFLAQSGKDTHRNFQRCAQYAKIGLSLPPTTTVLFVDPMMRDVEIHRYLNVALSSIGDIGGAVESIDTGLKKLPTDPNFLHNMKVYETALVKNKINDAMAVLQKYSVLSDQNRATIAGIIETNPNTIEHKITQEAKKLNKSKLNIVFYVGISMEPWNADILNNGGIGGSETAVIHMARIFAKTHNVKVYGDCIRDGINLEKTIDNVEYLGHSKYKNLECDVLIVSRQPHAVDSGFNIKSSLTFLWVHDVHCGNALTQERAAKIDKIFALTNWHKNYIVQAYPYLEYQREKIIVTQNGIDIRRFEKPVKRNPHKAVYSSSPDRGMQVAIEIWPKVRESIPDAELHIYYGFDNWEKGAIHDPGQQNLIAKLKKMLKDGERYGVVYHGRVGQDKLAEEYLSAGVWTLPTWWAETSCISAMEAHAAGLRMVTSPIAALNETVADRGVLIPGDWLSPEYQSKFTAAVIDAMNKQGDEDRQILRKYASENFTWEKVANDWQKLFGSMLSIEKIEQDNDFLIPYKPIYERQ